MNERLFRLQALDQTVGVGTTPAGVIFEMAVPRDNRFRTVWCYYDNDVFSVVGDEAWIQFLNNGELALEYPAALIPLPGTRLGLANYPAGAGGGAIQALPTFFSADGLAQSTNPGGPGVVWWDNQSASGIAFAVHPFRVVVTADTVRLYTNKAGNTRALLAVFSGTESP